VPLSAERIVLLLLRHALRTLVAGEPNKPIAKNIDMNPERLNHFRHLLTELHERVGGEVNYVVESIHEDVDMNANLSSAPVHLADVASEAVDADVQVLNTERSILEQINAALARANEGSYGECASCGKPIAEERLDALPYTSLCRDCAEIESNEPA
jgi:RNA polymerase-binding protein DksA